MNFGNIFRRALQRAELPYDSGHIDLAISYANEVIDELFRKTKDARIEKDKTISVVSSTQEYALDKLFDGMVKNSLQGPSGTPRILSYMTVEGFRRKTSHGLDTTGYPSIWTYGELRGFATQLGSASVVKASSSLANLTTGTIKVVSGSKFRIASSGVFTLNHVGLRVLVGTDTVSYKVSKFHSTTKLELSEKYRGVSNTTASYKLGDVGVQVIVRGIVSGQNDSEALSLDGTSVQTTTKTFSSVSGVSKSDITGGHVSFTDTTGSTTIETIAAGEYETERQTILLWPIPSASETLKYSQYRKHPVLRLDSDRLILKEKWHKLALRKTTIALLEWSEKNIPANLQRDVDSGLIDLENDQEDTSHQTTIPRDEGSSGFGDQYYYDQDEDFA